MNIKQTPVYLLANENEYTAGTVLQAIRKFKALYDAKPCTKVLNPREQVYCAYNKYLQTARTMVIKTTAKWSKHTQRICRTLMQSCVKYYEYIFAEARTILRCADTAL